jgi:hypothetical protein
MRILTEKQLVEIENQTLNKIYYALNRLHEKDNSDKETGLVAERHDELLHIALEAFSRDAHDERCYPWIRVSTSFDRIFFPKK